MSGAVRTGLSGTVRRLSAAEVAELDEASGEAVSRAEVEAPVLLLAPKTNQTPAYI